MCIACGCFLGMWSFCKIKLHLFEINCWIYCLCVFLCSLFWLRVWKRSEWLQTNAQGFTLSCGLIKEPPSMHTHFLVHKPIKRKKAYLFSRILKPASVKNRVKLDKCNLLEVLLLKPLVCAKYVHAVLAMPWKSPATAFTTLLATALLYFSTWEQNYSSSLELQ